MLNERYVEISQLVKAYPNPFGDEIKVVDGFNSRFRRVTLFRLSGTPVVVSPLSSTWSRAHPDF